MAFQHPLASYLSRTPMGGNYVSLFDPGNYEQDQALKAANQAERAKWAAADAEFYAERPSGGVAGQPGGTRIPPSLRGPGFQSSLFARPSAGSVLEGAVDMIPGIELGKMVYKDVTGQEVTPLERAMAGVDLLPGNIPTAIGSIFGTKKRYLFHGRGSTGAPAIAAAGANIKPGGMEINNPNTSYATRPEVAARFARWKDVDPKHQILGQTAEEAPERLTYYSIKDPSAQRNLTPQEYLDARFRGGFSSTEHYFPTDDPQLRGRTAALYGYPNIHGSGFSEHEVAAMRNQSQLESEIQSAMADEYTDLLKTSPGDPFRQAIEQQMERAVSKYHDPVLGRAEIDPYVSKATGRAIQDLEPAVHRLGYTSGVAGINKENLLPVQVAPMMEDVRTILASPEGLYKSNTRNIVTNFFDEWGPNIRKLSPQHAEVVDSVQEMFNTMRSQDQLMSDYVGLSRAAQTRNLDPDEVARMELTGKRLNLEQAFTTANRHNALMKVEKVAGTSKRQDLENRIKALEAGPPSTAGIEVKELDDPWEGLPPEEIINTILNSGDLGVP